MENQIRNQKFTMPEDAPIACKACGGTLRPVYEFVLAYLEDFRKALGQEPKNGGKFNCINCGLIYDEAFINTGNKVDWAEVLNKHYSNKEIMKGGEDKQ